MPPRIRAKSSWKKAGEIRRSQVVSTYGPGAIADFPRLSAIMAGLDEWSIFEGTLTEDMLIRERNLQKMLEKEFFVQVSTDEREEQKFQLPVHRFPRYYYCPNCHMLDKYKRISRTSDRETGFNKQLYCSNSKCNGIRLIPSRFVAACQNGHIDDFPYFEWVHKGGGRESADHQLFMEYKGETGGLDSILIRCSCGAAKTMAGSMDRQALAFKKCTCSMPWLGLGEDKKGWYKDPEGCGATMRTMQRSANNVYYPVRQSALTIPPWSSKVQQVIRRHEEVLAEILEEEESEERILSRLKKHFERRQQEYRCSENTFLKEVRRYFSKDEDDTDITEDVLRQNEYAAFCGPDRNEEADFFCTKSTQVPEELSDFIESVKIVGRLREVMVLRGFRRIVPAVESDPEIRAEEGLLEREFAPISKQPLKWLPAIQMFGEGIFIQLKEDAVKRWEEANAGRYSSVGSRLKTPWIGNGMFDSKKPRYVLLHTLAHLLIRRLTAQCGYGSASLREKIYSTFNGNDEEMCGILIYTSATDCDGSLGGLAREGDGIRLANTIFAMLEEATWCSNDPICIDSRGQGYDSLNLAACHACALLPETSCEANNCLLDRAAIVGTPENRKIGYFAQLLE